ncbi:MAG: trimethylamine methyltransferase family protein [Deltaproteobacteria bacterium]|jgi:trimethylamine--corrinoid protein Co-methyltransferase|nr:trimethylamine methyltransferase family protein [Deltaproteobacteria bacterium]
MIASVLNVLEPQDVDKIHAASLELLWETGVRTGARGRDILLSHGGRDRPGGLTGLPPELVEKALAGNRPFSLRSASRGEPLELLAGRRHVHNFGSAPLIVDAPGVQPRPSTLEDLIRSFRVLERLDVCDAVYPLVTPTDAPASLARVVSAAAAFLNSGKPAGIPVLDGRETDAAIRLLEAAQGGPESVRREPGAMIVLSPISPLTFNDDCVEAMQASAGRGVPLLSLPCPILGLTAPMSMAGGLTTQNMETLAFLTLLRLIDAQAKVVYGARLGFANMRSGLHMDGRPEKGLLGAAAVQLARKYGLPSDVYGMATAGHDANDVQTGYDKAFGALQAMLAQADFASGLGCLSHARVTSLELLAIDAEMYRMTKKITAGVQVDEESLAKEVIGQVMAGGGDFLGCRHTLKYVRSGEIHQSSLDRQLTHEKWLEAGRPGVGDAARAEVDRLLSLEDEIPDNQAVVETWREIAAEMGHKDYRPQLKLGPAASLRPGSRDAAR